MRISTTSILLTAAAAVITTARAHPEHEFYVATTPAGPAPATQAAGDKTPSNSVSITVADGVRTVQSNGWPDHAPGTFPRRGNPNTISPQSYTFRMPVKPKAAEAPERRGGWWWGVALNGVPFEPGTAETWNNDPRWRYEAATGFLNLGLDEHNAHVQPTGAYHYHALPVGLVERAGGDGKKMLQVGWAADGFPVYSAWAPAEAGNAKSELRKMKSSYQLRKGERPAGDGSPGGKFDGRFTQDFEFVKGTGDLDECNGRTGVTPEFPEGTYYYCITAEFPFVPRMWHGTPDQSFSKGDRPPGGGPGGAGGQGRPGGMRPPGPPPIVNALDLNQDGVIDAAEIAKAADSIRKLDSNGDGTVEQEEMQPRQGP